MRILVFFDLPVLSSLEKRNYRVFRKFLLTKGFIMMQESVYSKLVLNTTAAGVVITHVKKHAPPEGIVQLLVVTEKQFNSMEFVVGTSTSNVIDTDKKLVIV